ncbi:MULTISPECIES: DUF1236 domain-containing protein [unclassified Mesorhizobium]|uniref:DUF1236 domain-containing protein n=1 Tax=unclassified Mesorhizobium TaxID=325217 RepID=UPI0024170600|nr:MULTISPECIES: DUF1236 domain-containing protein [unclassified Mesorhizobium]MDG4901116.1 DUF1236 domain-containing protein [Mesorhizobium sp. WSM4962]MDG4916646.1 DUF1236 domain-containing protein [Mesorhizobium sp. WSM4989]
MKHLLITSMIALGVGCGAAMAQTESVQPSGGDSCAAGQADCPKGGKAGEQAQGKMKSQIEQNAQGTTKMKTEQNAQGEAGTSTEQNAEDNTQLKKKQQAQGKAGTKTEQNAQDNTTLKKKQQAQDKTGTSTEQNADSNTKVQTEQNAQGKTGTTTDQNAQGTTKMQTEQNAQGNVQTDQDKTASITNVTVEQRTQITQIIRETNVQPVRDVSFDISVGVEVPRQKIRLHRLPARIVKIVPAYETYMYFVLADGRIVIVDPDTYKIVVILEA